MIAPKLVDVIDVFSAQRVLSSGTRQQLTHCNIEQWGLSIECPTHEDPSYDGEVTWLLPDLGLRLSQYRPRRRHARRASSSLTAIHLERDTRSWRVTDLLLGLEIPDQGSARIIRSEDFAAAVAGGVIRLSEADYALRTVHRTLEEISMHRDLQQWLGHRGIFDAW